MRHALKIIGRRIALLLSRAVGHRVDPAGQIQRLQLEGLAGEILGNVEHFEPYGYTSHPQPGFEAILASFGGKRSHVAALVAGDRRYRVRSLAPGEIAISDDLGNVIHFKRDKILVSAVSHLEANAPTCQITATTTHIGDVTINGNLVVNGAISATGAVSSATEVADPLGTMQGMRDIYNVHDHPGDSGGTTGSPNQGM